MDDRSAVKMLQSLAPLAPRHYVVMEVKSNLISKERSENVKRFAKQHFKRIAKVVMGEPPKAHKDMVKDKLLKAKQVNLDWLFKKKQETKEKQKILKQKVKEAQEKK